MFDESQCLIRAVKRRSLKGLGNNRRTMASAEFQGLMIFRHAKSTPNRVGQPVHKLPSG
jgi:hypothetical protein